MKKLFVAALAAGVMFASTSTSYATTVVMDKSSHNCDRTEIEVERDGVTYIFYNKHKARAFKLAGK